MSKASKTPSASVEKDSSLSSVAEAAKESAKAALAKLDAMDLPPAAVPAPEKPPRRKAKAAPEGMCYGLIFGKTLKIRKTFSSMDAAFDHVRALPMEKAREVKLVTVQPLMVELRVEFAKGHGDDD